MREDKSTTKLRVVYDGSATTKERNYSLNDCLYIGPNNIPHLFNILVKFRSHAVGLVADIKKAFLMVGIDHVDRDMLRFLWVKNIQEPIPEIIEFRFTRLVFGLRPSPAMLGATINHHLNLYEDENPDAVKVLKNGLYVDDLVSGAPSDDEALDIYKGTKGIMLAGGFNLPKWASNSNTVVETITQAESNIDSNNKPSSQVVIEEPSSPTVIEEVPSSPTVIEVPSYPAMIEIPSSPTVIEVPSSPAMIEVPSSPTVIEVPSSPAVIKEPRPQS